VLGTKEVLRDAGGALVVAEDVKEFAAAVVSVLTRPELRASLASAGRAFVAQRWSSNEMAKRLAQLYGNLPGTRCAASTVER